MNPVNLPVFEMVINPEEGSEIEVSFVALVDKPAIEKNFLAFNANDVRKLDFLLNEEQRIISGPAMVADSLIYRKDEQGEYNVFFSKETIKDISIKFFKKGYEKNVNLFHDPNLKAEGVTIFESFISDTQRGIKPMVGFEDLPDGSWFISAKVENDEVWTKIKAGEVKGFSVEGIFSYVKRKLSGTDKQSGHLHEKGIMSELKQLFAQMKEDFKAIFNLPGATQAPVQLAEYDLKDGTKVSCDKLEAGGTMQINGQPAAPGQYELMDGTMISVGEGGIISEVKMPEAAPGDQSAAPDYSKQFASYDEKFTAYEQRFTAYEQKFTEVTTALEQIKAQSAQQNNALVSLMSIVERIVEMPTGNPSDTTGKNFSSNKEQPKEQRRQELAKLLSNLKTKQ